MENLCRLCLKEPFDYEYLFNEKDGWVIAELVKIIFPRLNISKDDLFTKNICLECVEIVTKAVDLERQSIASEEYLKSQQEFIKIEFMKQENCEEFGEFEVQEIPYSPQVTIKEEIFDSPLIKEVEVSNKKQKCPYCDKSYNKKTLPKHIQNQHEPIIKTQEIISRSRKPPQNSKISTCIDFAAPIGCSFCFKRFKIVKYLKLHLKRIHGIDQNLLFYFCAFCQFSTNHKVKLEVHIKTHFGIDTKPFLCNVCGLKFIDQRFLRRHLFKVHKVTSDNMFFCNECDFHTPQKFNLEQHMKRVHLKIVDDFCCDSCEIVCKSKLERTLHHYAHADIVELCNQDLQMLGCPICPSQFQFEDELLSHLPTHEHEIETTTACILCSKVLEKGYSQVLEHTKSQHFQKFTHRCIECNRNYFYGMKFLKHIRKHKELKDFDHLCTDCGAEYRSYSELNKHIRVEHEKIYKCPYCVDVVYKSILPFRQHVDGHTNQRKYKCSLCPKTFSIRHRFNSHYAFHLNDKMNQCPKCGKGFETANALRVHVQRHDGTLVKRHKCGFECGKAFTSKWARDQHERTHTNEKPFKCEHCPSAYKQKGDYMKHLKVHLGDKVHKCPDCPESFRLVKELNDHKMTKHHV